MVVSFAVWSSSELSAHVFLLNFILRYYTRPKFALRRDLFLCAQWHLCRQKGINRQNHPELFRNHKGGQQIRASICNMRYQKQFAFHITEAQKWKKYFQNGFEDGKASKWHIIRCSFGAVQGLLHLWLIVITFMVGSDYYIYGWFLLHLWWGRLFIYGWMLLHLWWVLHLWLIFYYIYGGYYIYGCYYIYGWYTRQVWLPWTGCKEN